MKVQMNYDRYEEFGRVRLSPNFFMRDFLFSEIAAWHGLRNVPDHPDAAIEVGRELCTKLLEPLQATFGRLEIRSAYRSPTVNEFGNKNNLNCASNESNYAAHIWDQPDAHGKRGATACIVVPWLVDHIARGGKWTDMAWWIHDHLPYSSLHFFSKLASFDINWHEVPLRRIDSHAVPKGCLTRPGMPNHGGMHTDQYVGFPILKNSTHSVVVSDAASPPAPTRKAVGATCHPPWLQRTVFWWVDREHPSQHHRLHLVAHTLRETSITGRSTPRACGEE